MSSKYRSVSKAQFEYFLTNIRNSNKLGFWNNVTEFLERETNTAHWEHVYQMATRNRSLVILIYSSIDRRTNKTRELAKDAVRIVYRWETPKGVYYAKVKTLYRVEGLSTNMETQLKKASSEKYIFNLFGVGLDWSKAEKDALSI